MQKNKVLDRINGDFVNNRIENNYNEILNELYDRYYKNFTRHSEVTSSHWHHIGRHKVEIRNGYWFAQGNGFGDCVAPNPWSRFKFLPRKILMYFIIKKFNCPSYLIEIGRSVADNSERLYDYDCIRQILSLNEILKQLGVNAINYTHNVLSRKSIKVACVIGDGYGYFSTLLKTFAPEINVISVNLGRTLFFDVLYSQKCLTAQNPVLLKKKDNKYKLLEKNTLVFCEAENYHILEGMPIDLFINITSMQEMNPLIINKYFEYIKSSASNPVYFYCCNRLEKMLPDGTVTRFMEYPWTYSTVMLDELCPWFQVYPISRPPFWVRFDGQIQHRFVKWEVSRGKKS